MRQIGEVCVGRYDDDLVGNDLRIHELTFGNAIDQSIERNKHRLGVFAAKLLIGGIPVEMRAHRVHQSAECSARVLDLISASGKKITTPTFMIYTRTATPALLAPDRIPTTLPVAVQWPSIVHGDLHEFIGENGGIRNWANLSDHFIVCTANDAMSPVDITANDKGSLVLTRDGNMRVNIRKFIEINKCLGPDMVIGMPDSGISSKGAVKKRIYRSMAWASEAGGELEYFPPLLGEEFQDMRNQSREMLNALGDKAAGYVWNYRFPKDLNTDKTVYVENVSTLEEVLDVIEQGGDMIETAYPVQMSETGKVMTFNNQGSPRDVDMTDKKWERDQTPVVEGCTCDTCVNHTKGYIYHLFNVKEMLGPILLHVHNLHHFERFFEDARASIASNCFLDFKNQLLK